MAQKLRRPDLSTLSEADKDRWIIALFEQVDALLAHVATLEAQARKNSSNSSKPPSSDGLGRKTRSLRESSGKPLGGQAGHKGTTLRRLAQPTQTIDHPLPWQCDQCRNPLPLAEARVAECRQVLDVPAAAFDVIEHRTLAVVCRCGQSHVSAFPVGMTGSVQYGPNVKALGVHLT